MTFELRLRRFVRGGPCGLPHRACGCPALFALDQSLGGVVVEVGLTLKVKFYALWQQAFTAVLAAPGEDCPSVFGLHPSAETELLFARALGRLVGAFHIRVP